MPKNPISFSTMTTILRYLTWTINPGSEAVSFFFLGFLPDRKEEKALDARDQVS